MENDNQPRQASTTDVNQNSDSHSSAEQASQNTPERQENYPENTGCDRTTVSFKLIVQKTGIKLIRQVKTVITSEMFKTALNNVIFQNLYTLPAYDDHPRVYSFVVRPPSGVCIVYHLPMFSQI